MLSVYIIPSFIRNLNFHVILKCSFILSDKKKKILIAYLYFYDTGVYSMCDGPALSHGPYLGTVTVCSFVSILLLSVKACVFTVNSQIEAEASSSPSRQRLHLKKSWGMPVLFLSCLVFALGHIVVAYRTSCRARRKLLFHRVDPEAVSFHVFIFI